MAVSQGQLTEAISPIPSGWTLTELGAIGTFKNGINKDGTSFGKGYPFVNLMDVFGVTSINSIENLGLLDTNSAEQSVYNLCEGDVLFIRSSVKPSGVGLTAVIESSLPKIVYSGFLIRFRDNGALVKNFKKHCFYESGFRRRIIAASSVSANTNINQDSLKQILIPVPPINEQINIADTLDSIDLLIQKLNQVIDKKRDINQATMQQLLTGKTRLPGFSGEWAARSFNEVFERVNTKRYQLQTSEYSSAGQFPIIDQGQQYIVGYSDRTEVVYQCPQNGVIVFGDHTCNTKFVDFNFIVGADGTQVISAKLGFNPKFFYYCLEAKPVKSTGYNRHFSILKEYSFLTPSIDEQVAISSILSDLDAEISAYLLKLEKLKLLKQGMMQELLTGRIRLI